jgi:hypothetical protein
MLTVSQLGQEERNKTEMKRAQARDISLRQNMSYSSFVTIL